MVGGFSESPYVYNKIKEFAKDLKLTTIKPTYALVLSDSPLSNLLTRTTAGPPSLEEQQPKVSKQRTSMRVLSRTASVVKIMVLLQTKASAMKDTSNLNLTSASTPVASGPDIRPDGCSRKDKTLLLTPKPHMGNCPSIIHSGLQKAELVKSSS
jgi:hypothetical protein